MSELLVYKASAGSGKTFTLAVEYIKLLILNPRAYRQILAVTFTNKATAEMKERILSQLYGIQIGDKDSEAYLNRIKEETKKTEQEIREAAGIALGYMLHDYSRFRVETIDSFFQSVMRNLARELELSPNLNIELNNAEVLSDAVDSMIEKLGPTSPVLAWLLDYINERIADDKRWNVSDEVKNFGRNIFDEGYIEKGEGLRQRLRNPDTIKEYRKQLKALETEILEQMKGFYDQFEGELEGHALTADELKNGSRGIGSYFRKLNNGILSNDIRNATVEKCLEDAKHWATKTSPRFADIIDLAKSSLMQILEDAEKLRSKNNLLLNSCRLSLQHLNKVQLLANIDEEVRQLNHDNNRFLLSDTNALLHQLVKDGDSSFVFEKIGTNIRNVMIDEFQDTSKLQWQNFAPLIGESLSHDHTDLIVGDVKQSIYRWRNSDWSLLNEGVQSLFRPSQYSERSMNMNYRSCACIVEFNNRIFGEAARLLQQKLEREIEESALVEGSFDVKIEKAYADIGQRVADSNLLRSGHVSVTMWESDKKEDFYNESLARIPDLLRDLQDRGYTAGDITFLTRTAREGTMLVDLLLRLNSENTDGRYRYDVISSESLLIRNSPIINLLIGILRYIQDPSIELNRLLAVYEYNSRKFKASDDAVILSYFEDRENIGRHLDNDFFSFVESIRKEPLFEMCERIVSYFSDEGADEGERVYIQAFQDYVLDYCRTHTADLGSFLSWWDDNEDKLSVTTPQEQDAMRVMTIHKSKGLEFKVVIIPFCNWSLDHQSNQTNFVWCHTHEEPFSRIPVLPLRYGSSLAQTYYATEYFDEKMYACIDNLNIAYVAFTRAEEELHIFAPAVKNKSDKGRFGSISAMLGEVLFPEGNDGGDLHYEAGIDWRAEKKKKNVSVVPSFPAGIYRSIEPGNRLHLRLQGKGVFGEGKDRTYGTLMHRILSQIETLDRVDDTIAAFVRSGELSELESKSIREDINRWLADERVSSWFSPGVNVWTEREILQPDGSFYRPDRVVETDNEVIVVDYKFGNVERASYKRQVNTYTSLIEKMGYDRVSGFIWYVSLGKLERV